MPTRSRISCASCASRSRREQHGLASEAGERERPEPPSDDVLHHAQVGNQPQILVDESDSRARPPQLRSRSSPTARDRRCGRCRSSVARCRSAAAAASSCRIRSGPPTRLLPLRVISRDTRSSAVGPPHTPTDDALERERRRAAASAKHVELLRDFADAARRRRWTLRTSRSRGSAASRVGSVMASSACVQPSVKPGAVLLDRDRAARSSCSPRRLASAR